MPTAIHLTVSRSDPRMPNCSAPTGVRFEQRTDDGAVLGIGVAAPRLTWTVPAAESGFRQRSYELEVSRARGRHTFRVESDDQVLVPWPDVPLASREEA